MARLLRSTTLVVLISLIFTSSVRADECLEDVLAHIAGLKPNSRFLNNKKHPQLSKTKEMLNHAAYHNDMIPLKLSALNSLQRDKAINEIIEHYAKYDLAFDQPAFMKWLSENPLKTETNETVGSFLNKHYMAFEKEHPPVDLNAVAGNVAGEMRKIAKECNGKLDCAKAKIEAWMKRTLGKSCIANSPASQRDLASLMLLTNSTYFISYATDENDDKEFPFDLMATNLFWQPFLSETACHANQSGGKIGQKIQFGQQSVYGNYGNNYLTYLKLSPAYNLTVMAVITAKDLINGKEIDWTKRGTQFVALTLYDAGYANQRILLLQNPLYLRKFPNLKESMERSMFKNIQNKTLKNGLINGAYYPLDWGSRVAIGLVNTRIYQNYMKSVENLVEKQRKPTAAPSPTSTPSNSSH